VERSKKVVSVGVNRGRRSTWGSTRKAVDSAGCFHGIKKKFPDGVSVREKKDKGGVILVKKGKRLRLLWPRLGGGAWEFPVVQTRD